MVSLYYGILESVCFELRKLRKPLNPFIRSAVSFWFNEITFKEVVTVGTLNYLNYYILHTLVVFI